MDVSRAESLCVNYIAQELTARERGITPGDVTVQRVWLDDLLMGHARIQQTFEGIPVFGGEAIVHLNPDGTLFSITDALVDNIELTSSTEALLSREGAIEAAARHESCTECLSSPHEVELRILRRLEGDYLAYQVKLTVESRSEAPSMPVVFVDAISGDVLWRYDNLQTGSGPSLYSGTVAFTTYLRSGTYYLEDISSGFGVFDNRNTTNTTFRYTDINDIWNTSSQLPAVDVAFGTSSFLSYLATVHGRDGIDGAGGPGFYTSIDGITPLISSKVRYGSGYNNAFWNGSYMTYGNGDGALFSPLVTLDIIGHEMMHGVTSYTAGLIYSDESGAINESWSDVFGALLELHVNGSSPSVWTIGEQCYTPGIVGDSLRSLANPHADANGGYTPDDNPDHYNERYTGPGDNGGVHINSGIANKAFYLLANGGAHHMGGSMNGIGSPAAAQIWYRALTTFMTSSTNFAGARAATLDAAAALYGIGSVEHAAVGQAWTLCGVL